MAVQDSTSKQKSNRINFTAEAVRKFNCPDNKAEAYLWDTRTPGLGIRAKASGNRSYVFQGTVNGSTRRSRIGSVDDYDIEQARTEAKKLGVLASQNISPAKVKRENAAAERAEEQEMKRASVTLGLIWSEYVEANKGDWGAKHYRDHLRAVQAPDLLCDRGRRRTKAGCLYPLVSVKLGEFTARSIKCWLENENKTRSGVAAQSYRLLFACLSWCTEQENYTGLIDVTSLKSKAVKKTVIKLKPRSDVLQKEQLPAFFAELLKISNPIISAYLQTLLLTGARRNELAGLQWSDVDFKWQSMAIRDKATSKGSVAGVRIIPLTPYVASLLIHLPRRNQWVFSSPAGKDGKLTDPRKSYDPAVIAAGIEGLTLHGLRRSFSTLSEWVEVPTGVVAQIMGHKPSATAEKHYKQRPLDLLRKWQMQIEVWILKEAGLVSAKTTEKRLTVVKEA
jgi:integrase